MLLVSNRLHQFFCEWETVIYGRGTICGACKYKKVAFPFKISDTTPLNLFNMEHTRFLQSLVDNFQGSDWKDLCINLGVNWWDMNRIDDDGAIPKKAEECLDIWKKRAKGGPLVDHLVYALRKMELNSLREGVERFFRIQETKGIEAELVSCPLCLSTCWLPAVIYVKTFWQAVASLKVEQRVRPWDKKKWDNIDKLTITCGRESTLSLRGAWRDRDTNDIFAHCSLIFYFPDFQLCLSFWTSSFDLVFF